MVQLTAATTSRRQPYTGPHTTIVIAIDVGTTFSGVSYAVLRPGDVPFIQGVTRFPDQDRVAGDRKVPSILYYDKNGDVRAAGATVQDQNIIDQAEDEEWLKVEHFKLHLRPSTMQLNTNGLRLGALPFHKDVVQVFGDFLRYLYSCAIDFIKDAHVDGPALWNSVQDKVHFVLSHPNGWEGSQQSRMRQSAIHGGLIPDTPQGHARVTFVTEGEASMHACLSNGLGPPTLHIGDAFIIADAGGGTLDFNTYEITQAAPLRIQEIAIPDCRFAGSVFVNRHARDMLEDKLKDSKYDSPECLDHIIDTEFDKTTKRLFSDISKIQYVKVGGLGDRDARLGIRSGKLRLEGAVVAECFQFSVREAVDAIMEQKKTALRDNMDVWLVGGFAASPWLLQELKSQLAPLGLSVCRPDTNTSKVVADGAVSFYLDRWVTTRVARLSSGLEVCTAFDNSDPQHVRRRLAVCRQPSGRLVVDGQFRCFVSKGTKVAESTNVTASFFREVMSISNAKSFEADIVCYKGDLPVPTWMDECRDKFETMCTVRADLSALCHPSSQIVSNIASYWRLDFDVEFKFGLTEYEARIKWKEEGSVKYGPATIIYEEIVDNQL